MGKGSTLSFNFLIFFFYKLLCCTLEGVETSELFMKYLSWSLYWLGQGVWPKYDVHHNAYDPASPEGRKAGTALCPGGNFRGILWAHKADLEWNNQRLNQPAATATYPCACCRCNITDCPWTDCRPGVCAWTPTIWTVESWSAAIPLDHRPHLLKLPGYTMVNWVPDHMHCKHLGTDQTLYASVLKFLTHHLLPGSPEDNLNFVWDEIRRIYKDLVILTRFLNFMHHIQYYCVDLSIMSQILSLNRFCL